jgi:lycopene cyclase domain-containing protein
MNVLSFDNHSDRPSAGCCGNVALVSAGMQGLTYLFLDLFTLAGPLALSFDRRVRFVQYVGAIVRSIPIVALPFLVWDLFFTLWGVWGFSDRHTVGLSFGGLPLEEILFFFVVPYAVLFIYECLRVYLPAAVAASSSWERPLLGVVAGALLIGAILFSGLAYTGVVFGWGAVTTLAYLKFAPPGRERLFLLAYLVHLIPFGMVNGVLTAIPVVWYDDTENLGLRVGTIPFEDFWYSWSLFLGNVLLFERARRKV